MFLTWLLKSEDGVLAMGGVVNAVQHFRGLGRKLEVLSGETSNFERSQFRRVFPVFKVYWIRS